MSSTSGALSSYSKQQMAAPGFKLLE
ncbi:hypothetical protein TIFTF001_056010, partial [Ficus carica]